MIQNKVSNDSVLLLFTDLNLFIFTYVGLTTATTPTMIWLPLYLMFVLFTANTALIVWVIADSLWPHFAQFSAQQVLWYYCIVKTMRLIFRTVVVRDLNYFTCLSKRYALFNKKITLSNQNGYLFPINCLDCCPP